MELPCHPYDAYMVVAAAKQTDVSNCRLLMVAFVSAPLKLVFSCW